MKKLNSEQKARLLSLIKKTALLLAAGIAYYIFIKLTGLGIPCVFRLVTGNLCPGCGVTRMCISLLRGDLYAAMRNNLLIMVCLPFFAVIGIRQAALYVRCGKAEMNLLEKIFFITVFLLMIPFTVMRNMDAFAYLAPIL